ncbi:MAG: amidohydrolase [Nitrospinota bacterium]|nr:amidohydrolase [Nitrospinota bacterium]
MKKKAKRIALRGGAVVLPKGIAQNGLILIKEGRIEYAGAERKYSQKEYETIDITGMTASPGLIDAHTHLGVYAEGSGEMGEDGNEMIDPVTPHVRAIDSIDPEDPAFGEARADGVTSVMITPGSGNVIGGAACVVKTRGRIVEEMIVDRDIGQKMATGENPKRVYGGQKKAPMTRMGIAAVMRTALVEAQNYRDKIKKKKNDTPLDLRMEALQAVISGKKPARVHAHRADDIMTAIRIADEFGMKIVVEHGTEAYKIADILAAKKIRLNLGPSTTGRSKVELKDLVRDNAARCIKAGCIVSLITDHPVIPIQELRQEAIKLVRDHGAPRDEVFKAITSTPAATLGITRRAGSLERGKDADVAVYSSHPLDPAAVCHMTMINGEAVFRRD